MAEQIKLRVLAIVRRGDVSLTVSRDFDVILETGQSVEQAVKELENEIGEPWEFVEDVLEEAKPRIQLSIAKV